MSRALARTQRLVRVRHVQHTLAVAETMAAQDEANAIAHNATRVKRVREELFQPTGVSMGGSFAAYRELADRLERAGRQLDGALYDARRKVGEKQDQSLVANRDKEIAERLRERARDRVEARLEARIAALPNYRRMQLRGNE